MYSNELIACLKNSADHYGKKMVEEKAKTEEKEKSKAKADVKAKADKTITALQYTLLVY